MTQTMRGVRILEVADHTFVPAASGILADWGADVIKVEHVERGDAMRGLGNTGVVKLGEGVHVLLEHSNRRKLSIGLDLTKPEGVEILYKLAATCDVFLTNKTPSIRAKLGIDVDDLRKHAPQIIYVRGSAYGPKGPDADSGGYDMTAYWCRSGNSFAAKPYGSDTFIVQPAPGYGDSIGAMTIAGGIAAALLHREKTGEATTVDVSLLHTGVWAMGAAVAMSAQMNFPWAQFPPGGAMPGNPFIGNYYTSDGKAVNITVLQAWHYWPKFWAAMGRPEVVDDERFASLEKLTENTQAAKDIVTELIASMPYDELKGRLREWGGQWAPIQSSLEVIDDEMVVANGYVASLTAPNGTDYKLVTSPVQFNGEAQVPGKAPDFNEHCEQLLVDGLGMTMEEVLELKVAGVVA